MNLITQTIALPAAYSVSSDALAVRSELLARAAAITSVSTPAEQELAAAIGSELQTHIKDVHDARMVLTKPFDLGKAKLIDLENEYVDPLIEQRDRIGPLLTEFALEQEKAAAEAERARQAEFQRLENERQEALQRAERARKPENQQKAELDAYHATQAQQDVLAVTVPEPVKAKGAPIREELCHEVVDARAVYAARPDLCEVTVKASAVKAVLNARSGATKLTPDTSVPGLKLWWETKTSFRRTTT